MRRVFRTVFDWQIRLSRRFDRLLPASYQVDGHDDFRDNILPQYIGHDMLIYDVGGGARPYVTPALKRQRRLRVIGLDIDAAELARAPAGAYDATICADLTDYRGRNDADLVICQATLEHVRDTERALAGLATIAKPGGRVAIFVPSRNAVFARLNLLLPESVKRFLLYNLFPYEQVSHQGHKAYYDRCVPRQFAALVQSAGFQIERQEYYFMSFYFGFLVPLHVLWRFWVLLFRAIRGDQAAETFVMVLRPMSAPAAVDKSSGDD
jgi:2-polyprenyl-6-hydroxyphenyl methylase/3-demethylubiquinone-9 3-methyltransferase